MGEPTNPLTVTLPQGASPDISPYELLTYCAEGMPSANFPFPQDLDTIPTVDLNYPPTDSTFFIRPETSITFPDPPSGETRTIDPAHDLIIDMSHLGMTVDAQDPLSIPLAQCMLAFHPDYQFFDAATLQPILPYVVRGQDGQFYAVYFDYHEHLCSARDFQPRDDDSVHFGEGGAGLVPLPLSLTATQYDAFITTMGLHPPQMCLTTPSHPAIPLGDVDPTSLDRLSPLFDDHLVNEFRGVLTSQDIFSTLPAVRPDTLLGQEGFDPLTDTLRRIYRQTAYHEDNEGNVIPQTSLVFLTETEAEEARHELAEAWQASGLPTGALEEVLFSQDPEGYAIFSQVLHQMEPFGIDEIVRSEGVSDQGGSTLYAVQRNAQENTCTVNGQDPQHMLESDVSQLETGHEDEAIRLLMEIAGVRGHECCEQEGHFFLPLTRTALGRLRDALQGENVTDFVNDVFSLGSHITPYETIRGEVTDLESRMEDHLPPTFQAALIRDINHEVGERYDSVKEHLATFSVFGALAVLGYALHRFFPPGGRGGGGNSSDGSYLELWAADLLRRMTRPTPTAPPSGPIIDVPVTTSDRPQPQIRVEDYWWVGAGAATATAEVIRRSSPTITRSFRQILNNSVGRAGVLGRVAAVFLGALVVTMTGEDEAQAETLPLEYGHWSDGFDAYPADYDAPTGVGGALEELGSFVVEDVIVDGILCLGGCNEAY